MPLADHPDLVTIGPDCWLYWRFDEDTHHVHAVLMHYDQDGRIVDREQVTAERVVDALAHTKRLLLDIAVPLNTYLASGRVA